MNPAREVPPLGSLDPEDFANAWVGVPFRWDGRDRRGVDCWGLVWRFHRDCLGLELPDWSKGARGAAWIGAIFAEQMVNHWRPLAEPRDCAIVLSGPLTGPAHTGIVLRGGVLHAELGRGVVWEALGRFVQTHAGTVFGEWQEGAI